MFPSGWNAQFSLPFSIRMQPPTSLIPFALKALFSKISHDLKAAWDSASVYCKNVCMCKRGFLALRGITCVCFLGLDKIRLSMTSLLKPASVCCHSPWLTKIFCMWARCGAVPSIDQPEEKIILFFAGVNTCKETTENLSWYSGRSHV